MDLRTWQEAGTRVGSYSARHRARSPFSPLRPAPMAIGSLSTAAIAAFAFVAPGILHGTPAGSSSTVLDGAPNVIAPMAAGNGGAAPGFVSVTAPSSPSADSPAAATSTADSSPAPVATSSSPAPLTVQTPTGPAPSSPPSGPTPTQSQQPPPSSPASPSSPTMPGQQPPTTPPTTPGSPVAPPTTALPTAPATKTSFNSAAAVSSALAEISNARSQQGINLLRSDSLLGRAAKAHAQDMARTGDFSHIGSDGSDPFSRAANLGCYSLSQELIAHGKPGDDVIGALMRDPASKRALLSFWNSAIGISAQQDPATGDVYWTIELGWM